jgi:hypothetical protein
MATSKRKFITWTYVDEATNKEYPIQVYALVENDNKVSFEAEVKLPVQFTDRDENANVLRARVFARCAADRRLVWEPYIMITVSKEDHGRDPLKFDPARRNYLGIGLLFETFESALMPDGTRIWRGIAGKSTRFSTQARPGWPPTGLSDRGSMSHYFKDMPENRKLLRLLATLFSCVGYGLQTAADPTRADAVQAMFHAGDFDGDDMGIWGRLARLATDKETSCPENESNSASPAPSAPAGPA